MNMSNTSFASTLSRDMARLFQTDDTHDSNSQSSELTLMMELMNNVGIVAVQTTNL